MYLEIGGSVGVGQLQPSRRVSAGAENLITRLPPLPPMKPNLKKEHEEDEAAVPASVGAKKQNQA